MFDWDSVPRLPNGRKIFIPDEFDDPLHPGSGKLINPNLMRRLCALRMKTGWPVIIHGRVGGAVDVDGLHGHAPQSLHRLDQGAKAADWHFVCDAPPSRQLYEVIQAAFGGIGCYFDWRWDNKRLPIGFHTDVRSPSHFRLWKRTDGAYEYF